jgi:hypothetical protein
VRQAHPLVIWDERRCKRLGDECQSHVEALGFAIGQHAPNLMYFPSREVRVVVHGDDFPRLGPSAELELSPWPNAWLLRLENASQVGDVAI